MAASSGKDQNVTNDIYMDESFLLAENPQKLLPNSSTTSIFSNEVEPVKVQIRDIGVDLGTAAFRWTTRIASKSTHQQPKQLLRSVSADLQPGSLTAIIGGSGSGKTTLLDALSDRLTGRARVSQGSVVFNGRPGVDAIRHAYVTQNDVLLPTLTVRETLRYAADLRLPPPTTAQERYAIVEDVIAELGLQKCANTRIGNSRNRGCSGGEKRRVSIGVQLLANPSLLCLDEPTTGLDAASAFQLATTLRRLSERGRVVITTIHQPRSEIWSLFDNLIVLADGGPVYSGPVSESLPWFKPLGFDEPPFINPADFIIDTAAIDYRGAQLEAESRARVSGLKSAWSIESQRLFPLLPTSGSPVHTISARKGSQHTSQLRQLRVLTRRTVKVTYRDPLGMTAAITEAIIMGLAVGYMFYDLGVDQAGIRSRQGCLYVAASLQGYLTLIFETYRMSLDMPNFDREALEHCASPVAFVFSRRLARLPTEDLPVPLIFSILVYFMTGLDHQAGKFLIFFIITMLNHYIAVLCAMACVVISRNFASASLIASLIYTLQSIASGMIVQVDTIPIYVRWTRWITYTFYTFSAYIANEFEGNNHDCPFPGGQGNPECAEYSGDFVIKALGFPRHWTGRAIVCMVGFVVFFLSFSILGLHYLKPTSVVNVHAPEPRKEPLNSTDGEVQGPMTKMRPVTVELEQFELSLRTKTIGSLRKSPTEKRILDPIDVRFEPGVLNVIIGPSGSGKSSLLNAMARRLRSSIKTKYCRSGSIRFNGIELSDLEIQSVCSYVHQDGELLLPAMTVRETLRYAAALRLPRSMTAKDKNQRAEETLLKMGLKNCADTLIGSDSFRGISGGEQRRVSLAIQILTEPQVLLVDEPTSGLDAFTANSIVQALQDLAKDGRTIIMAIHQPRSDLFCYFGNILLLSQGGSPVYCGPANEMTKYLGERGYDCPVQTNPADFALDMITDFHQQDPKGEESRQRVQGLIQSWRQRVTLQHITAEDAEDHGTSPFEAEQDVSIPARITAFHISFPLLIRRAITNTYRQPQLVLSRIMQSSGVAIIFTLFFAHLGHDYLSIQTRLGFFQQLGGFYIIGMLTNAAIYPDERDVAYREMEDGAYGVDSFLASYTIVELPFEIINSFFFGALAVFAVGLPHTAATFFVTSFACFSGLSCGESLGIMFNTLFSHTGFAINLMGVFLALANSMAGVLSLDMPSLFVALNYLSPIRYQVRGVAYYALRGLEFDCKFDDGSCPIATGDEALKLYNFDEDPSFSIVGMAACVLVYRLLAWGLLRVARNIKA
ncbi:putative ABC transporter ATP-binding protein/permease [Neonectria ditissima]|uniref:Putative ABC transporter ATP-binding protein/permease n=1 Tax=Neonectria ditissima TaxID=78410 RepID=A0A0P7BT06_9HYPO|nr:putative ABC transporter ATP-binding protein/permease [Neonectria ditissima]